MNKQSLFFLPKIVLFHIIHSHIIVYFVLNSFYFLLKRSKQGFFLLLCLFTVYLRLLNWSHSLMSFLSWMLLYSHLILRLALWFEMHFLVLRFKRMISLVLCPQKIKQSNCSFLYYRSFYKFQRISVNFESWKWHESQHSRQLSEIIVLNIQIIYRLFVPDIARDAWKLIIAHIEHLQTR